MPLLSSVFYGVLLAGILLVQTASASAQDMAASVPPGLVDQQGRTFDAASLKGRWHLMYFGFTHCPEVCPTSLFEMTAALDLLAPVQQEQITPVFVTVDPKRDTPELMAAYVKPLGHGIVTVSGDVEAIDRFAISRRIVAVRNIQDGPDYTVDHTSSVQLLDPQGREVERFPYDMDYHEVSRRIGTHMSASAGPNLLK
ncbi:SCO family protein [Rhizobium sp. NFR03]|uniref:SCO family protein n=1 Tax=Rhizobium sp. NFR03 TaxID=1566263 RepID=UPI0008CFBFAF|nr:SCO family protein [Rhizobium sp. NFR03]SES28509.1 protein SCO1/2 [Rhizobium sp. NFR03]